MVRVQAAQLHAAASSTSAGALMARGCTAQRQVSSMMWQRPHWTHASEQLWVVQAACSMDALLSRQALVHKCHKSMSGRGVGRGMCPSAPARWRPALIPSHTCTCQQHTTHTCTRTHTHTRMRSLPTCVGMTCQQHTKHLRTRACAPCPPVLAGARGPAASAAQTRPLGRSAAPHAPGP